MSPGRPRSGVFVVVVGPDGCGKTTLARALVRADRGPTGYFHFRPAGSGHLAVAPDDVDQPQPKTGPGGSVALGWVRIAVAVVRFWYGYLRTVRPALVRDALVVGDRWCYGYLVQPTPLGFHGPTWLARLAVQIMPRPDLVVNLHAPPTVIHGRKQELGVEVIAAELDHWRTIAPDIRLDASADQSPETLAELVLKATGRPTSTRP
jgi:energy-coupling factor transporter ATP-binding protein EcfA2